jgi:hypothetical protein
MALTPGGTPYVESSDLVADYPTVSLALAEHIDDLPAKVLQVVRATDATTRTTTSTSFVDASISVTITPQKNDSAILLIWTVTLAHTDTADFARLSITDSSNNAISGAEGSFLGSSNITNHRINAQQTMIAYSTPATTSPTTYKGRFRVNASGTASLVNATNTGQLYAFEVSA